MGRWVPGLRELYQNFDDWLEQRGTYTLSGLLCAVALFLIWAAFYAPAKAKATIAAWVVLP